MKTGFGYIRVSTQKQGEGVSLEAQRDAIAEFAHANQIVVTDWFAQGSTAGAARAGLDLEMPGPGRFFGPALAEAVRVFVGLHQLGADRQDHCRLGFAGMARTGRSQAAALVELLGLGRGRDQEGAHGEKKKPPEPRGRHGETGATGERKDSLHDSIHLSSGAWGRR